MPPTRSPSPIAFRFQGRRALLTYSNIGTFDAAYNFAERLVGHIEPLGNELYRWKWAVEQHHEDDDDELDLEGPWDVHIAIDLGKACTERGNIFDFEGYRPGLKNVGGKLQWKKALNDLENGGCFMSNIEVDEDEEGGGSEAAGDVFREALGKETVEEYMETIAEGCPEDYCKSYISIRACGRDRYAEDPDEWTATRTLDDFINVPAIMSDYANYINSDEEIERPRALIIISPTRYGKTQWARSINANHAYMQTEWNPDCIRNDARLLIFDDVPMSELMSRGRWKAFMGMQTGFNITGKYRGAKKVKRGGKGFIYLCNYDPRRERGVDRDIANYITGNCDIVTLNRKLYA